MCFRKQETLEGVRKVSFSHLAVIMTALTLMDGTIKDLLADDGQTWFVMRDLKPRHAKLPAYKRLKELGIKCYTPTEHRLVVVNGKRVDREVPFMQDLLFVKGTRALLDPVIATTPKLQYRYQKGARCTPIIVRSTDMERFIYAVETTEKPRFYKPEEVTPDMRNRPIRIIGGRLDGYTGTLITTRGSKVKRLLVELPMVIAASVEVEAEFIQFIQ